jgi:hypothetical protein
MFLTGIGVVRPAWAAHLSMSGQALGGLNASAGSMDANAVAWGRIQS